MSSVSTAPRGYFGAAQEIPRAPTRGITCVLTHAGACSRMHVQAIHPSRRAAEQGQLLFGGRTCRDVLKGVPQRRRADAHLFHGEIALEHATVWPEVLDAGLQVGAPVGG